jgi:hypothetical protein
MVLMSYFSMAGVVHLQEEEVINISFMPLKDQLLVKYFIKLSYFKFNFLYIFKKKTMRSKLPSKDKQLALTLESMIAVYIISNSLCQRDYQIT